MIFLNSAVRSASVMCRLNQNIYKPNRPPLPHYSPAEWTRAAGRGNLSEKAIAGGRGEGRRNTAVLGARRCWEVTTPGGGGRSGRVFRGVFAVRWARLFTRTFLCFSWTVIRSFFFLELCRCFQQEKCPRAGAMSFQHGPTIATCSYGRNSVESMP